MAQSSAQLSPCTFSLLGFGFSAVLQPAEAAQPALDTAKEEWPMSSSLTRSNSEEDDSLLSSAIGSEASDSDGDEAALRTGSNKKHVRFAPTANVRLVFLDDTTQDSCVEVDQDDLEQDTLCSGYGGEEYYHYSAKEAAVRSQLVGCICPTGRKHRCDFGRMYNCGAGTSSSHHEQQQFMLEQDDSSSACIEPVRVIAAVSLMDSPFSSSWLL